MQPSIIATRPKLDFFKRGFRPFGWIAGPCSAESEAQVLETAHAVKAMGIRHFRMGVWKPRTRPGGFAGHGALALPWVGLVQAETGLRVMTEVASAEMVEGALCAGADALWLGARTTASPFAVQEVADALRGCNTPVLVKNPVNPDLALWLGALERLQRAGTHSLAACHRGFSYYGKQRYRNLPLWEIPLELRRRMPELPLFCDPSHIAGKRHLVPEVAQHAADFGFDGLMLEVHPTPDFALSDAEQQLTPDQLAELVLNLKPRLQACPDPAFNQTLAQLRLRVDELDAQLLDNLARRLAIVSEIGLLKHEHAVRYFQLERWQEVLDSRLEWAQEMGLSPTFIAQFLQQLHAEALRIQTEATANDCN